MKRKTGRLLAIAGSLLVAMATTNVGFAATTYTPVSGDAAVCTFNKYLIMDAGDGVPNATFEFEITPGTPRSASTSDNSVMQVLAGTLPSGATSLTTTATFSPSDSTATTAGTNADVGRAASTRGTGLTAATGVELESGEKYATKQATIDFSGCSYDEPGIYRYVVTEKANAAHAAAGIMHDNDVDRILDVYVIDNAGTLEVSAYVLHLNDDDVVINATMGSGDVTTAGTAVSDKSDGFTNEVSTKDLRLSKTVSGNQASRDKWFEFTVKATEVNASDVFAVSIADDSDANTTDGNADATTGTTSATRDSNRGQSNPTSVTGAQLSSENGVKFYLQHGQNVVIRGLPINATYAVTEDAEDYSSAVMTGKTNSGTIGTVAGDSKVAEAGFANTRNGVIPTGVAVAAGAGIAAILIGGAGFVMTRKKREEDEDDE